MGSDLFSLRAAREDDLPTICAFAAMEGMDAIPSIESVQVAESASGDVVGFIRIVLGDAGEAHVNPVVVYPSWRGYGVGRALVEDALARHGQLRLVSRGSSLAFYEALGFAPIPWEAIDLSIAAECDGCEMFEECTPTPVVRTASAFDAEGR